MPQNKRESMIYTVLMCFVMVFWMSMYNVTLHMGGPYFDVLREGWVFPLLTYTPCALTGFWFPNWQKALPSAFW